MLYLIDYHTVKWKQKFATSQLYTTETLVNDSDKKSIRTPEICAAGLMKEKINWFSPPGIACFGVPRFREHQGWSVRILYSGGLVDVFLKFGNVAILESVLEIDKGSLIEFSGSFGLWVTKKCRRWFLLLFATKK